MDEAIFSPELLSHCFARLTGFENERSDFVARLDLLRDLVESNYQQQIEGIEDERNIVETLKGINEAELVKMEQQRLTCQGEGTTSRLRGLLYENREKLIRLLIVLEPAGIY
ncbi:MAG: hypothetical protein EZS28_056673, partial [Streblomastix strix]